VWVVGETAGWVGWYVSLPDETTASGLWTYALQVFLQRPSVNMLLATRPSGGVLDCWMVGQRREGYSGRWSGAVASSVACRLKLDA
jgi:hypothetical protein